MKYDVAFKQHHRAEDYHGDCGGRHDDSSVVRVREIVVHEVHEVDDDVRSVGDRSYILEGKRIGALDEANGLA